MRAWRKIARPIAQQRGYGVIARVGGNDVGITIPVRSPSATDCGLAPAANGLPGSGVN